MEDFGLFCVLWHEITWNMERGCCLRDLLGANIFIIGRGRGAPFFFKIFFFFFLLDG